jgi:hypothetical protein
LPNSSASITITDYNADTKQVIITIEWQELTGSALKNISLATLITKMGGL